MITKMTPCIVLINLCFLPVGESWEGGSSFIKESGRTQDLWSGLSHCVETVP